MLSSMAVIRSAAKDVRLPKLGFKEGGGRRESIILPRIVWRAGEHNPALTLLSVVSLCNTHQLKKCFNVNSLYCFVSVAC